ncbi:MAG: protein-glutamate O-methyltransferase CheR [Deltaproteobacteria bacterium]|nr:protein-glutamate O-methyltransferase CheR [Deltaproteobacteria bacterium]MBN2674468.1 protein-glutamate O-methyltransferase CheR [Deltaproteobacteria bacterium]
MLQDILGEQLMLNRQMFTNFQELIYITCGIALADNKRTMLSVRLLKRLRALNFDSYEEYFEHIQTESNFADELQSLLNVVTTNKTDFYREKHHFQLLAETIIPELRSNHLISSTDNLRVWSAGCSSGEEPYTLAMVLSDAMGAKTGSFEILATDISTKVLQEAMSAVYCEECVAPIPEEQKKKYLLRGTGNQKGFYKIAPEIRKHVKFGHLNFVAENYRIPEKMHVVFCRNVLIYFDTHSRDEIVRKLCNQLVPHGYLFIGHSETLDPQEYQLERLLPTVYRRKC